MSSVDERIVRMEFDNTGFEAGATKAAEVLEKLDSSLKLDNAANGIENISQSLSGFNLDSVSNALDNSAVHFSAFEEIGIGALRRVGEMAVDLGHTIVSSITNTLTSGAKDGFSEYNLQMNSLQTISANSGESMEVIKDNLNELNEYADKTVYNFSEMTANIGRFTAAGLDVETSTKAIKGFANMAALAGAGSQETSRGMYQLSQAMAAGVVKLQDWKSIQNASIDTAAFKDVLIETARVMGTEVDAAIEKEGSFNASLSEGWLTAEVMAQALDVATRSTRDFADEEEGLNQRIKELVEMGYTEEVAKKLIDIANAADDSAREVRTWKQLMETAGEAIGSGWAKTWEIIIGDFDEATQLFTTFSKRIDEIVGAVSDARNAFFTEWKDSGGRDALIGIISNLAETVLSVVTPIKDAFLAVFGMSGEQLAVFTENIAIFTEKLVLSEDAMNAFNSVMYDVFTIIHSFFGIIGNGIRIFATFLSAINDAFHPFDFLGSIIDSAVGKLAAFMNKLHAMSDSLEESFELLVDPIAAVSRTILDIFGYFYKAFVGALFSPVINKLSEWSENIVGYFTSIWEELSKPVRGGNVSGISSFIYRYVTEPLRSLDTFLQNFKIGDSFSTITDSISKFATALSGPFASILSFVIPKIESFASAVSDKLYLAIMFVANSLESFKDIPLLDEVNAFIAGFKIPDFMKETSVKIGTFGTNFLTQAKQYVKGSKTLNKTKGYLKNFADKLLPNLTSSLTSFYNKSVSFLKGIYRYFTTLSPSKLAEDINHVLTTVRDALKGFSPELASGFEKVCTFLLEGMYNLLKESDTFGEFFVKLKDSAIDKLSELPGPIQSLFQQVLDTFTWAKNALTGEAGELSFDNIGINLTNLGTTVGTALSGFVDGVLQVPDMAGNVFDDIVSKASEFVSKFPSLEKLGNISETIVHGGLIAALIGLAGSFKKVTTSFSTLATSIGKWPTALENGLKGFGEKFGKYESKADAILKVAGAIALLAGSLFLIASIPSDDLIKAGKAMAAMAVGIVGIIAVFQALEKAKFFNAGLIASVGAAFGGIGVALLSVAAAAAILSFIPEEQLNKGIQAVASLMAVISLYALSLRTNGRSILVGSIGLIVLAFALGSLVDVVESLGGIKASELESGLDAFTRIMAGLSLFGAIGAKGISMLLSSFMKFGVGIAMMSLSLVVLAVGLKKLSDTLTTITNLQDTLLVAAGFIAGFVASCVLLKDADCMSAGLSILAFSAALVIMAAAISGLAMVDTDKAATGMALLAALIAEFAIIAHNVASEDLFSAAFAMVIFGGALLVMAGACAVLAKLADSMDAIGHGLTYIGLLMGELALIAKLVDPVSLIGASAAMVILGASLIVMAYAFKQLESVNMEGVSEALMAVAAVFAVFGAFSVLMAPLGAALVAVAGGLLILSAAIYVTAAAFNLFADAIVTLNEVGPENLSNVMAGFAEGLGSIFDELIAKIPALIQAIAEGIINGILYLAGTALELVTKFGEYVIEHAPELLNAGIELVKSIGEAILGAVSFVADTAPKIISSLTENFAPFMGGLLTSGAEMVTTIVGGITDALPGIIEAGGEIVDTLVGAVGGVVSPLIEKGASGVSGFVSSIIDKLPFVKSKSEEIADNTKSGVQGLSNDMGKEGTNAVQAFIDSINSKIDTVSSTVGSLVSAAKNALTSLYDKFKTVGTNGVQGLIDGLNSKLDRLKSTASNLGTTVYNSTKVSMQEKSPSKLMRKVGAFAGEGLILGLADKFKGAYNAGATLAQTIPDAFSDTLSSLSYGIDDLIETDYNPVITPVIDPTQFNYGLSGLNDAINSSLLSSLSIEDMNYNEMLAGKMDDLLTSNRKTAELMSSNLIDYGLLGMAVANGLIASGLHVEMDGGEVVGYIAGTIQDTRRMYT